MLNHLKAICGCVHTNLSYFKVDFLTQKYTFGCQFYLSNKEIKNKFHPNDRHLLIFRPWFAVDKNTSKHGLHRNAVVQMQVSELLPLHRHAFKRDDIRALSHTPDVFFVGRCVWLSRAHYFHCTPTHKYLLTISLTWARLARTQQQRTKQKYFYLN